MILGLRYFGDPILRMQAKPVEEITEEIRDLCRDMIESMLHYDGIGLAAPQVGYLWRIFISNVDFEDDEGKLHLCSPKVYINPVLTNPSVTLIECNEACLSLPKLSAPVARPLSIHLEAMDIHGNLFTEECNGYQARNRMHEIDHLNGILFIDRIKGKRRTALEPILRRIKSQYPPR